MITPYYQDAHVTIYHGDCREVLPLLPASSVHTCVSSPPYFGLRDYGGDAQIGLESTPAAYVAEMTAVFEEVRRVLRQDGNAWLNLGDSYTASGGGGHKDWHANPGLSLSSSRGGVPHTKQQDPRLKPKDLIGIPWRVAFALQDAGWYLRSDIIWSKGNPMPESVTDRPTKAHEYLFLLAKAEKYYYDQDAIREPHVRVWDADTNGGSMCGTDGRDRAVPARHGRALRKKSEPNPAGRNRRSVWNVNTQPYAGAHFAVFPEKLIEPCILAGCPPGGTVLDPFGGSGTTARVAKRLGRTCILIEQNLEYCRMAADSLTQEVFDFVQVAA